MTANGWFQIGLYLILLLAITKPMGVYMTRVFSGEKTFLDPVLRPVERLALSRDRRGRNTRDALDGVRHRNAAAERCVDGSPVRDYARAAVASVEPAALRSGGAGFGFQYGGFVYHQHELAGYSGETTMSYFTQMAGLAYHNFCLRQWGLRWRSR